MGTATLPDAQSALLQTVRKVSTIATLPEVTAKIISTVEDPKSSAAQLHKLVSHDPALVTRILKVVNSAFYGLPGQVASVERAIVLLGLNAVKNIAVAASLGQLFRGVKLCEGYSAKDLWTHCVAVGITARELAKQMRIPLGDEAFLAGMIHDIGLLVSLQAFPEKLRETCEQARAGASDFCAIERQNIGMDHQQLGQTLAEQWKFPRSCQLVAGFHHQPTALSDQNRLLVTLVYIADTLCCQANQGFNLTALNQKIEDSGMVDAGVDMSIVQYMQSNLATIVNASSGVFG